MSAVLIIIIIVIATVAVSLIRFPL